MSDDLIVHSNYPVMLPQGLVDDLTAGRLGEGELATYAFFVNLHTGWTGGEVRRFTRSELAEQRRVSKRTLQRHLEKLEKLGWLRRRGQAIRFHVQRRDAA